MERRKTRTVRLKCLLLGNNNPIAVQTMLGSDFTVYPEDYTGRLYNSGCDILRIAYNDVALQSRTADFVRKCVMPVVADIHYSAEEALSALSTGVAAIRINPGNMRLESLEKVVKTAGDNGQAIRIGLNSGSFPKDRDIVAASLEFADRFEKWGFGNIVISLKSSSAAETVRMNRELAGLCDYPIHIGLTEAGDVIGSAVKSTWALGTLLAEGIGDTIRVSVSSSEFDEVRCAAEILRTVSADYNGINLISCPMCARHSFATEKFIGKISSDLFERFGRIGKKITVAVMGCVVNGPGEAQDADIAITGVGRKIFLYKHGKMVEEIASESAEQVLFDAICELL